ncbi:hypothetical protein L598_004300000250 [Mesorhizobium sp. J18]|nr:hypothetical protein L598_004300000250 [Mesorhizobium sp. J18]
MEYGETALRLPITIDREPPDPNALVHAAREHGLTIFDAAYLEPAIRFSLPFATLDPKLSSAARNAGVRRVVDRGV